MSPVLSKLTCFSLLVVLLACSNETGGRSLTEVIVEIDADDSLKTQAASFQVMVEGAEGVDTLSGRVTRLDETREPVALPKRVAIIPRGGHKDRAFVLTATLLDGEGDFLAQARVISGFVTSEVRYAKLVVEGGACRQLKCASDRQTCANGSCVDATVRAETLSSTSKKPTDLTFGEEVDQTDSRPGNDPEMDAGTTVDGSDGQGCTVDNGGCDTQPRAICSEGVGRPRTCTCPTGYTGSGKGSDGCLDVDECGRGATSACGEGATACENSVGGFTCTCGAGFSGSGTKACTDTNECSRGVLTLCGAGANGCTNKAGGYRCSCEGASLGGATYALNKDGHGCHTRAWSTAAPIESQSEAMSEPTLAVDGEGALAVWSQAAAPGRRDVVSSRFSGSWSVPVPMNTDSMDVMGPVVAGNASGNAVVAWLQFDGSRYNPWARGRSQTGTWDDPKSIGGEIYGTTRSDRWLRAVMDASGNAFVIWQQFPDLWVNRHQSDGTWAAATALARGDAPDTEFAIALNAAGDAMAAWRTNAPTGTLASNRRPLAGDWGTAAIIQTGTTSAPYLASDSSGNVLAVWQQGSEIWTNRFTASTATWGTAKALNTSASIVDLASDGISNTVAALSLTDSNGVSRLHAQRYLPATDTWEPIVQVADAAPKTGYRSRQGSAAINGAGHAVITWIPTDGTRLMASFSSGTYWTTTLLVSDGIAKGPVKVVLDTQGNATAIWGQASDIWAARYE